MPDGLVPKHLKDTKELQTSLAWLFQIIRRGDSKFRQASVFGVQFRVNRDVQTFAVGKRFFCPRQVKTPGILDWE